MAVKERGPNVSYWVQSERISRYPALEGDIEVDVAIIGAGLVGITAAMLLKRAGKRVVVVEMDGVARGVTGYTTAKVTTGHNLIYGRLERDHGPDAARDYAGANEAGLHHILRSVADENIDCDLERKANENGQIMRSFSRGWDLLFSRPSGRCRGGLRRPGGAGRSPCTRLYSSLLLAILNVRGR